MNLARSAVWWFHRVFRDVGRAELCASLLALRRFCSVAILGRGPWCVTEHVVGS